MVWLLSDIKHYYLLVQIKAKDSKTLNIFHKCVLNHYPFNLIHLIHLPIYLSFKFAPNVRKLIIIKPNEDLRRSLSRKRSVCISRPKMKVLDKENRVMVEPLSIGHFQDMEMCFPEWRLHLSEGHQYNGYGKFFFFFFFFFHLESKFASCCFEERCSKTEVSSAKGQQYQSYRNIFFFHSESKFSSRCFEQRCSKAEVPSAKKLQEHFFFLIWSQYLCPCFLNAGVPKETYSCSNWPMHYHRGLTYVGWHDEQSIAFTAFRNLSYLNA